MIELSVSGLSKGFQVGEQILNGLTFQVDTGERVGLLGKNGAGKTTLFRILTGELEPDEGEVTISPGRRVGLISQIPVYPESYTVETVLRTAFRRLEDMKEQLQRLEKQMERGEAGPDVLNRYDTLSAAFQSGGGYDMETALNKVCGGLGLDGEMRARPFSALSGGERTRINLARLILEDTDILLLDEPTNHLDLRATEWLEDYLEQFHGTVLAISHDRWFLDRVVKRIVELREGRAELYPGNYSFYVQERQRREQERLRQYEKERAEIQRLEETARKMHEHNTEHLHKRAFSIEKRIERLRTADRPARRRAMKAAFGEREFHGDLVFEVNDLSKGFEGHTLFSGVSLELTGGERVALLGNNGAGKSTFLKLLLRELEPDGGNVRFGPSVKAGYLPQLVEFERPERTLMDTMLYETNCSAQAARDRLGAFQFRGEDVFKPVSALSGGERSRLRLCILMGQQINLLILDEPTNHLDIDSREWIESALEDYGGALLFVSHDRYFIHRFASRVWMLEGGEIQDYRGTYDQYLQFLARRALQPPKAPPEKKEKPKRPGGTKPLEKQLAAAEREVERAEKRMEELTAEMEQFACDYVKLQELGQRRQALEEELSGLYAAWETLADQLEQARK
ncbi:MAG: ABC-F family ATP-binding cassette domain-containing protein [Oscillospiraceae bacterium]|nr:ABC-F family ATP-binding cassette domain-containing protein [Oscillospiraceae bacterium]